MKPEIFDLPLIECLPSLAGSASARAELIEISRDRFRRFGGYLGHYVSRDEALMERDSRRAGEPGGAGGLTGVPVSVKDLFGVEGYPIFAGSPRRLPGAFEAEGPVVGALRRSRAVITGKTHTVEFAFGGLGTNPHWPVPRNPWDARRHRVPGGSSAGAGVSIHCDAMLALGTDTAGSVRIPASMTGCVGLKTSYGRWPLGGVVPLSPSLDSAGLLGRTIADVQLAFQVLDAQLAASPAAPVVDIPAFGELRLGIGGAPFWDECSPGIAERVEEALRELSAAGAVCAPFALPETGPALEIFALGHLAAVELYEFLNSELPDWLVTLDPKVAARMSDAASLPAAEYLRRRRVLRALGRAAAERIAAVDALLVPTVAVTPPALVEIGTGDAYRRANLLALRNTAIANLLGLCALTMPVGLDEAGMPTGLQLIAIRGAEHRLLAVARAFERRLGSGAQRLGRPPLPG
jgi:aspartyl-tRNA(Asn)/glutamyl-tRNA(Gln) amidotransferase subunit A